LNLSFLPAVSMMLEGWNMHATTLESLPIAVIGGGPVGLAAAAHLIARNLPVKLYEAGPAVGANLRDWGHVRVFTPWRYCVDAAAAALLDRQGWRRTDANRATRPGQSSSQAIWSRSRQLQNFLP
jgi:2-polyprenyl-6-methoxyphenol hydroxylase-like FAD-dependent oxidoreductase